MDLVDAIEDVLGLDDGADDVALADDDWQYEADGDGDDWQYGSGGEGEWHYGSSGGGSTSGVQWYGTETPYEATSRVLAEQHATNLEVIDNIDGHDDYEYEVVTY